jgi:hypothetical protein
MSFSQVQRVLVVEHYLASRSCLTCQDEFRDTFPDSPGPNKLTVSCLVNHFRDTGSVQDRNRSGRPSLLSDDSLNAIRQTLLRSSRKLLRKLSLQSGLSYGSVHKATKILNLHPYRVHVMHELKEPDKEKRLQYCRWFKHFIRGGIDISDKVFYGDEAWFLRSGYINSQNNRICSAENPHVFHDRPLHSLKDGLWCSVSRRRIIGPIFFSETITAERYQELIMNSISLSEVDEQDCWFQQDGATAKTANSAMQMSSECFADRIISRNLWPPRSPDLPSPDFYLWGLLKENVYKKSAHIWRIETKYWAVHFKRHCTNSSPVASNTRKRVNTCIAERGGHFQNLI